MLDTVLFSGRVVQTFTCQCDDSVLRFTLSFLVHDWSLSSLRLGTGLCVRAQLWTAAMFCLSQADGRNHSANVRPENSDDME